MKRYAPFILLILLSANLISCKKWIQQQEEKAVMTAITNGYWYVYKFTRNDTVVTASFSGYKFKFDASGVVTGTKDTISQTGTWSPNLDAKTITSNFPNASVPVQYLNAVWKITDSYTDKVLANTTDSTTNITSTLDLRKQ